MENVAAHSGCVDLNKVKSISIHAVNSRSPLGLRGFKLKFLLFQAACPGRSPLGLRGFKSPEQTLEEAKADSRRQPTRAAWI